MRTPTITFARPRRAATPGEPIELLEQGEMTDEFDFLAWPDPRTGPSRQMSSDEFFSWLCVHHTNLEQNILVAGFVGDLLRAVDHRTTTFFKTAEPPAPRIDMRLGEIAPQNLGRLVRHAKSRTLSVRMIEDLWTGVRGVACIAGSKIVGVFMARDIIVLE